MVPFLMAYLQMSMMAKYGKTFKYTREGLFYPCLTILAYYLIVTGFSIFKHSQYSVGVLYLIILNLPRSIRFKPENVIIAGIISGPSEPIYNEMNSFLRPLVKELNSLWEYGFTLDNQGNTVTSYAALLGSVCDIPAT